jgi:hypothetical protein
MKGRFIKQAVLAILLMCQFSVCLAVNNPDANDSSKYLDAVWKFADKGDQSLCVSEKSAVYCV